MTLLGLILVATAATQSPTVSAANHPLGICGPEVKVLKAPMKLPARLHNDYIGYVDIAIIVDAEGAVSKPRVVAFEWRAVGRTRVNPNGYNEFLLSSIVKWKFTAPAKPCRKLQIVNIKFQ